MVGAKRAVGTRFRVWIVRYEGLPPVHWLDIPPGAIAVEPAEKRPMTARQARHYVEAFNRAARNGARKRWAVALPVTVRYEGDPHPGGVILQNASKCA
jgi:hypothetical protein